MLILMKNITIIKINVYYAQTHSYIVDLSIYKYALNHSLAVSILVEPVHRMLPLLCILIPMNFTMHHLTSTSEGGA